MTGQDMLKTALTLLGYTDGQGNISAEARFKSRALAVLNQVYADLFYTGRKDGFIPLRTTQDKIDLPERALRDVMPYGVAAFLAQSESDGDQQQYFAMLYNQKRKALTRSEAVRDMIPSV